MDTITIDTLMQKIAASEKPYDTDKIMRAYRLADEAHEGQMRSSGEKYITHPLSVASILLDYLMDTDTICAALLQVAIHRLFVLIFAGAQCILSYS